MAERGPNVVFILSDQQRWDTVGAYGCPLDLTPNLDAMARRGVRFGHAADPHERINLVGRPDHVQVAEELRARLIGRMVAAGASSPQIVPARYQA